MILKTDLLSNKFQVKWFICCDLLDKFLFFLVGCDHESNSFENIKNECTSGIWGEKLPAGVLLNFRSMLQELSESTFTEVETAVQKLNSDNDKRNTFLNRFTCNPAHNVTCANEMEKSEQEKGLRNTWDILITRMAETLARYGF